MIVPYLSSGSGCDCKSSAGCSSRGQVRKKFLISIIAVVRLGMLGVAIVRMEVDEAAQNFQSLETLVLVPSQLPSSNLYSLVRVSSLDTLQ